MSKATIVGAAIYLLVGGACATGGQNGGDDKIDASTSGHRDASNVVMPDAPKVHLDGGVKMDAPQVSQTPDAGGSGSIFCTGNSQCTNAGECCVTLGGPQGFCGPGQVVLGQCVPQ